MKNDVPILREAWQELTRCENAALGDHLSFGTVEPILRKLLETRQHPVTVIQCPVCSVSFARTLETERTP